MKTSVVTRNGKLKIPGKLRAKYGFKAGLKVAFRETDNGLLVSPMNEEYFQSFVGILKRQRSCRRDQSNERGEKELEGRKLSDICKE